MNKENIKKSAIYEYISNKTWNSVNTIKAYFSRYKKDILNSNDVDNYIFKINFLFQNDWGWVYAIVNNNNGKKYIWSTKNFIWRNKNHITHLINNNHKNKYLQEDFNKYKWKNFEFVVLEKVYDFKDLFEKEIKHIKNTDNVYNIDYNHIWYWNAILFLNNVNKLKEEISLFMYNNWYVDEDWNFLKYTKL